MWAASKSKIIAALTIGIMVRELAAPFTGHPFDFELWLRLGYYVYQGNDPYSYTNPIQGISMPGAGVMTWLGYPPTWAFFQAGLYALYSHSGLDNRFAYYFIVKQPMIISDVLCGLVLYKIMPRISGRASSGGQSLMFWMLCPFVIIISSIWGMFDQIIFLIILSSALLATKPVRSALLNALGFILKVIPLIYLPILAFSQESKTKMFLYLSVGVGASVFFSLLPYAFFQKWNVNSLIGVGIDVSGKISTSMNFWSIVYVFDQYYSLTKPEIQFLKILAYVWVPALLVASYFCVKYLRKGDISDHPLLIKKLLISMLFITLVFFVTKSAVNEQYTIYFLGFGLVDYFVFGSKTRQALFHAIWITALAFTIVNNSFMVRFLDAISTYYVYQDYLLTQGLIGSIRFGLIASLGVVFSLFCILYLWSLFHEMGNTISNNRP